MGQEIVIPGYRISRLTVNANYISHAKYLTWSSSRSSIFRFNTNLTGELFRHAEEKNKWYESPTTGDLLHT